MPGVKQAAANVAKAVTAAITFDVRTLRRRLIFPLLAALSVIIPIAIYWYDRPGEECTQQEKIDRADGPLAESTSPVSLSLHQGEKPTLAFGRTVGLKRINLRLDMDKPLQEAQSPVKLRVDLGDFTRDDFARIPRELIGATASAQGQLARLELCVDRQQVNAKKLLDPGRYSGPVIFNDVRVEQLSSNRCYGFI